jgi:hypothetical protein
MIPTVIRMEMRSRFKEVPNEMVEAYRRLTTIIKHGRKESMY